MDMDIPRIVDDNPERRKERERQLAIRLAEKELEGNVEKKKPDPKAEMAKMALTVRLLNMRGDHI